MDPVLTIALKAVAALKSYYDTRRLREQIETIEQNVLALGERIDHILDIDVRSAFQHLDSASRATSEKTRQAEFTLARSCFVRMTERPIYLDSGTSEKLVAAVGHAGNYSYFLMNDEPRLALLEAYLCTQRFPMLGVQLFPVEIFSRDYRKTGRAMTDRSARRSQATEVHSYQVSAHKQNKAEYYREMAWKVPLAGVVFLGFLAAGVVAPPLAAQAPMRAAGILGGLGNRGITDIVDRAPVFTLAGDLVDPAEEVELMQQAGKESATHYEELKESL
jgi:hypothetical protein